MALADAVSVDFQSWKEEHKRLSELYGRIQWLFGPDVRTYRHALEQQGYAMRIECRDDTRDIYIGTQFSLGPERLSWSPLTACTYMNQVLSTPHLGDVHATRARERRQADNDIETISTQKEQSVSAYQQLKDILRELNKLRSNQKDLNAASRLIEQGWAIHDQLRPGANRDWVRRSLESHEERFTHGKLTAEEIELIRRELEQEKRQRELRRQQDEQSPKKRRQREQKLLKTEKVQEKRAAANVARHEYRQIIADAEARRSHYQDWLLRLSVAESHLTAEDGAWARRLLTETLKREFKQAIELLESKHFYDDEVAAVITLTYHTRDILAGEGVEIFGLDEHVQRLLKAVTPPPGRSETMEPVGNVATQNKFSQVASRLEALRGRSSEIFADMVETVELLGSGWEVLPMLAGVKRNDALNELLRFEKWFSELPFHEIEEYEMRATTALHMVNTGLNTSEHWKASFHLMRGYRFAYRLPFERSRHNLAERAYQLETDLKGKAPLTLARYADQLRILKALDANGWLKMPELVNATQRGILTYRATSAITRLPEGPGRTAAIARLEKLVMP